MDTLHFALSLTLSWLSFDSARGSDATLFVNFAISNNLPKKLMVSFHSRITVKVKMASVLVARTILA